MSKRNIIIIISLLICNMIIAQNGYKEVKTWNFRSLSDESVANLDADTQHWGWNTKGRYVSQFDTDGTPLMANGSVISEYDGILIGHGVESGSLLLWKSESSNNGLQMQRSAEVIINGMTKDHLMQVKIKSSSKNSAGIMSLRNMTGMVGDETYTTTGYKTYEFTISEDGEVAFTPSPGVIIQSITLLAPLGTEPVATPEIHLSDNSFTITCATEGADIYYCLVDHGNA